MLDPLDFENRVWIDRLRRKKNAAWMVLLSERISVHFWRIVSWCMAFAGLWLMGLPGFFGPAGGYVFSAAFFAGLGFLIWRDAWRLHLPDDSDSLKRLEIDNGFFHRPLSSTGDRLANPQQEETRTLWKNRWARTRQAIEKAHFPRLKPMLAQRDPLALRIGAFILLFCGVVVAGPGWKDRLVHGLFPFSVSLVQKANDSITLWITPPEYTGIWQMVLQGSGRSEQTLEIPEGSIIKARVSDGLGRPELMMGETVLPMEDFGSDAYGIETVVTRGEELVIRQLMMKRAVVPYTVVPDAPPTIAMEQEQPEIVESAKMRFPLIVQDDYGVRELTMTMDLDDMIEDAPLGHPVSETRSVMSPAGVEMDLFPIYDLTAHPWAGLPVVIGLTVTDHPQQTAAIAPIRMTLPERHFLHPVARRLVEIRKQIIWEPLVASNETALELESLLLYPEDFGNDIVVYLAIRTAASRLIHSPGEETAGALVSLLWDTALRIEDGNLSHASRNLRNAQQALEQALNDPDATDQEIAELMDDLREAMAEYFMELHKEMQKRQANGEIPMIPSEMLNDMIDGDMLSSMLDQMMSDALNGDKDAARELLSQLQRMMDVMDPSSFMTELPRDMKFMEKGVNEMQELIDKQKELLAKTREKLDRHTQRQDQSFGDFLEPDTELLEEWDLGGLPFPQNTAPEPSRDFGLNTQEDKGEQEALRFILGQLMREADEKLGEIPENMGFAELEMRSSAQFLGGNDPATSIPHQEKAIEYLEEAQEQMQKQLMQRLQRMTGITLFGGGAGQKLDPLGRPQGGDKEGHSKNMHGRVEIPNERVKKRVDEILRVLRERSGERDRPEHELEYFRRLLKQF